MPEEQKKLYNSYSEYLKKRFQIKVFKVSLNAGFTCPNIDGTKGYGGCIYCSKLGSGDFAGDINLDINSQFMQIKQRMHKKWPVAKYIPYFQAHTNTYAPLSTLKPLYEQALSFPDVVGLNISTRPDCIDEEKVKYLHDISKRTYLTVELGLQTSNDKTSKLINRCHTTKDFLSAFELLKKYDINTGVHIINGLPYETKDYMMNTAKFVSDLNPHLLKIHLINVIKDTALEKMYFDENLDILNFDKYIEIVCDQLEIISPQVVIGRLTGDADKNELVAPLYSLKKFVILNEIDRELQKRKSYQGKKYFSQ